MTKFITRSMKETKGIVSIFNADSNQISVAEMSMEGIVNTEKFLKQARKLFNDDTNTVVKVEGLTTEVVKRRMSVNDFIKYSEIC